MGSTFLWIGIATDETSPFVVAEARLLVGAVTAAAAVALTGAARAPIMRRRRYGRRGDVRLRQPVRAARSVRRPPRAWS